MESSHAQSIASSKSRRFQPNLQGRQVIRERTVRCLLVEAKGCGAVPPRRIRQQKNRQRRYTQPDEADGEGNRAPAGEPRIAAYGFYSDRAKTGDDDDAQRDGEEHQSRAEKGRFNEIRKPLD